MSRFLVEFEVANFRDIVKLEDGTLRPNQVRRAQLEGVVDPGAASLALPKAIVTQLGLKVVGKTKVRYADGRRAVRTKAGGAQVTLLGREGVFDAVVEPKRTPALIGAFVLESLDLLVDCKNERLFPRDPDMVFNELESEA